MTILTAPNPATFTEEEAENVQHLLEGLVRALRHVPGGGKMEEGYWSFIYHSVRGTHAPGWSNLPMRDYAHAGLGVEMKLLRRNRPLQEQGNRLMHPAATRTISFDPAQPADVCMRQVLNQFGQQIATFRERVAEAGGTATAEIRWGVLLWSPTLTDFLYFEERMGEPSPDDYYARFVEGTHRGKATRNLHVFERGTDVKRFSVTLPNKGAKVQPYFDVPKIGEGAYAFSVPDDDRKPLWVSERTVELIERAAAGQDPDEYLRGLIGR